VPTGPVAGYISRRLSLDGKMLTREQAEKVNRVFNGLAAQKATLKSGHAVTTHMRAILYIIENLG
jgi:hypothetical protein